MNLVNQQAQFSVEPEKVLTNAYAPLSKYEQTVITKRWGSLPAGGNRSVQKCEDNPFVGDGHSTS